MIVIINRKFKYLSGGEIDASCMANKLALSLSSLPLWLNHKLHSITKKVTRVVLNFPQLKEWVDVDGTQHANKIAS